MVRAPFVDKKGLKRGAWSEEEDDKLRAYILRYKAWNWSHLPRFAGLARCGKSCRMRWENYLKPGLKRGAFSKEDEELILRMQKEHGNKWSLIAKSMSGRTDNEIKNYWHTILSKRTKQDPNSGGSTENATETSDEMHVVDQNKKASATITISDDSTQSRGRDTRAVDASADADCLSQVTSVNPKASHSELESVAARKELIGSENEPSSHSPARLTETYRRSPEELLPVTIPSSGTTSNNQNLPSSTADFATLNDVERISEDFVSSEISSMELYGEAFGSLGNESILVKSSTLSDFTLDILENPEESFSRTFESFSSEPFSVDNSICEISSSNNSDFYPSNSAMVTQDCWSPEENFSATSGSILTEPFSMDASNSQNLESTQFPTSTLLNRLESLESFGFWQALWDFLQ